jgi:hypothetical protein
MRSVLVLGLLIAVIASAQAATTNHHYTRHHVFISPRVASSFNAVPSYNDPSKYGGEAALPVQ